MSSASTRIVAVHGAAKRQLGATLWKQRYLFLLLAPGLAYFVIYRYLPIWGILMAFQDFIPNLGFFRSPWVGLKHFDRFFGEPQFTQLLVNTLVIALYNLVFYFPVPIVLALLLNEVRGERYKRFVQTTTYLPHFLSWVVIAGVTYTLLSTKEGVVNHLLEAMGFKRINFLLSVPWFRPLIVGQAIWRDAGWGTIVFLAALSGVDVQLYEAAIVEGANRWQKLWYITLPWIRSTIIIILILRLGQFLDVGFEQILLMSNAINREVAEVFDTYVYEVGIRQAQFSYSTAVGLFKAVIGLALVYASNKLAKKVGEEGVF
jgi:putative aldouronate transport system permease protein